MWPARMALRYPTKFVRKFVDVIVVMVSPPFKCFSYVYVRAGSDERVGMVATVI